MVPWSVPRERVGAAETIGRLVARSAAVRASRTRILKLRELSFGSLEIE